MAGAVMGARAVTVTAVVLLRPSVWVCAERKEREEDITLYIFTDDLLPSPPCHTGAHTHTVHCAAFRLAGAVYRGVHLRDGRDISIKVTTVPPHVPCCASSTWLRPSIYNIHTCRRRHRHRRRRTCASRIPWIGHTQVLDYCEGDTDEETYLAAEVLVRRPSYPSSVPPS